MASNQAKIEFLSQISSIYSIPNANTVHRRTLRSPDVTLLTHVGCYGPSGSEFPVAGQLCVQNVTHACLLEKCTTPCTKYLKPKPSGKPPRSGSAVLLAKNGPSMFLNFAKVILVKIWILNWVPCSFYIFGDVIKYSSMQHYQLHQEKYQLPQEKKKKFIVLKGTIFLLTINICDNNNRERHTRLTIISCLNPKQWVIVHTSDLMMILRQSIYILSIIMRGMGKLKTHSPTYCIMDNWENMLTLTHTLDKIYLTGIL